MKTDRQGTRDGERWYPRDHRVANWVARQQTQVRTMYFLLALFVIASFGRPYLPVLTVLLLVGMATVKLLLRGRPYGWKLGDEGLHELRYGRPARLIPWSEIEGCERTDRALLVRAGQETIRLPFDVPGLRHLAGRIEDKLAGGSAQQDALTPEQVAELMAIGEDEALPVGLHVALRLFVAGQMVGGAAWLLAMAPAFGVPYLAWTALFPAWMGLHAWDMTRPPSATASGIDWTGHSFVGWDEVSDWRRVGLAWELKTGLGPVLIYGRHARRVIDGLERLREAAEQGAILPRMTDVPDHAISRAESAEVSAERGISPAEEERR